MIDARQQMQDSIDLTMLLITAPESNEREIALHLDAIDDASQHTLVGCVFLLAKLTRGLLDQVAEATDTPADEVRQFLAITMSEALEEGLPPPGG